jgi:hypothetical protein
MYGKINYAKLSRHNAVAFEVFRSDLRGARLANPNACYAHQKRERLAAEEYRDTQTSMAFEKQTEGY